ncbi:hypothetical protein [Saccharopolyspora shandongensis]|uniref:hypothetical protein n=1 Tax=Saccharopolyspora shandongensis TaxID=418495 RepID=UPI003F4CC023
MVAFGETAKWSEVVGEAGQARGNGGRARIPPAAGTVEAIDDATCVLHTGADTPEALAINIGQLGMHGIDFTVGDPPELVELLRSLANRYLRAIAGATRTDTPTTEG